MNDTDIQYMTRAIELACEGRYITRPNPSVGCVLVKEGEVIGEGHTQPVGGPHAERVALAQAGENAAGATAYVSLEPCSHHGRTPPCADGLIEANVVRVVYAMQDPYGEVSGRGIERLKRAGIQVDGPLLESKAYAVNPGFFRRVCGAKPWVVLKTASSLDGGTALASGESKWITGDAARQDVQLLRAQSCAIVTGVETVLADDCRLTLREDELSLNDGIKAQCLRVPPLRVVLDTKGRLSGREAIFDNAARTLWVTGSGVNVAPGAHLHTELPLKDNKIDLEALLEYLASLGCNQVMVEAGATLSAAFFAGGLVDEWFLYQAPKILGMGHRDMLPIEVAALADAPEFEIKDLSRVGPDLKYVLRPLN